MDWVKQAAEWAAKSAKVTGEQAKLIERAILGTLPRHQSGLIDLYRSTIRAHLAEIDELRQRVQALEYRLADETGRPMLPLNLTGLPVVEE